MASADVATAKASATLINNLIIVSSHVIQDAIESEGWNLSRSYREIIAKESPTQAGASLNSQASRLFSISDGGMEFGMPNGPTSRETSRKATGNAVTIGLVLAAVVATFVLFGPVLLKSDQKSMDVVATQPTDSPIKTP